MSKATKDLDAELADFDEEETINKAVDKKTTSAVERKGYSSVNSSGFKDFLLKPEILRAIVDCGFEHPSEVQHDCIPQAILGNDILCQAKSGMGKTAVFVISVLQQLEIDINDEPQTKCVILCHTRELAFQICNEFARFSKYLPELKVKVFYGGIAPNIHIQQLKNETPHIVVGTPGRIAQLTRDGLLKLGHVKHFIIDECDKVLESLEMRTHVQEIFKKTPKSKQVMMFSATLSDETRSTAKKFMSSDSLVEIHVDNQSQLTLHGLQQYYVKLKEEEKNKKLLAILDALEYNQLVIFVRTKYRTEKLEELLSKVGYNNLCSTMHSSMTQEERIKKYTEFKEYKKRIMISTDLLGRGIDIQRVNIVINYDMPDDADTYLHRVGRAGRFGTKGLAISFISSDMPDTFGGQFKRTVTDEQVLEEIQKRFEVKIKEMPAQIDVGTYMTS
ncbi:hypothetical protein ABK040_009382 [Willaertia magna]